MPRYRITQEGRHEDGRFYQVGAVVTHDDKPIEACVEIDDKGNEVKGADDPPPAPKKKRSRTKIFAKGPEAKPLQE